MSDVDYSGIAHELWAAAQLVGEDGIADAVDRMTNILADEFGPVSDNGISASQCPYQREDD